MRILLACAAPPFAPAHIAALARECDAVIAADGGAAACAAAGVRPDLVIGDMDSIDHAQRTALSSDGVAFQVHPADKDVTDLDLAIGAARGLGASDIVVTGAFGARLDHTLVALGSLARAADLRPAISEPQLNGWVLAATAHSRIQLTGPGATISIVPLLGDAIVDASGVTWPLAHERLGALSSRGLSNIVGTLGATLEVSEGLVAVLAPLVGGRIARRTDEITA